jgi:hypothetical protein
LPAGSEGVMSTSVIVATTRPYDGVVGLTGEVFSFGFSS